jgi:hypothetical protein
MVGLSCPVEYGQVAFGSQGWFAQYLIVRRNPRASSLIIAHKQPCACAHNPRVTEQSHRD